MVWYEHLFLREDYLLHIERLAGFFSRISFATNNNARLAQRDFISLIRRSKQEFFPITGLGEHDARVNRLKITMLARFSSARAVAYSCLVNDTALLVLYSCISMSMGRKYHFTSLCSVVSILMTFSSINNVFCRRPTLKFSKKLNHACTHSFPFWMFSWPALFNQTG